MEVTTPILKKHQVDPRWKETNYRWTVEEYTDIDNPYSLESEMF